MIRLKKAALNTVILTLSEKLTLSSPKFLFVLTSEQSNRAFPFIAADLSIYPQRYNRFTITEKDSPDLLNGEAALPHTGHYRYAVYEQDSTTNLDPALSSNLLETGICLLVGQADELHSVFETENENNNLFNG